jgi:hypothetical protein
MAWFLALLKGLAEKLALSLLGDTLDNAWKRFDLWIAYIKGKRAGAADQRMRDIEGAIEVEQEMDKIMVERRDTTDTRKRLDDGTF